MTRNKKARKIFEFLFLPTDETLDSKTPLILRILFFCFCAFIYRVVLFVHLHSKPPLLSKLAPLSNTTNQKDTETKKKRAHAKIRETNIY